MGNRKIKLPVNQLRAVFKPESYDEKRNTMDLVWTTGARVKRNSWFDGPFYEELAVDKKSVRLDRLNSGAPLLNEHGTRGYFTPGRGLRDIIGVVERASIENGEGVATVRFSTRAEVQDLIGDIKEGIIRNVSVGYVVHRFEEQEEETEDGAPVYRAVDWEPMEISFVGMPADPGAQARAQNPADFTEAELAIREGEIMGKKIVKRSEEPKAEEPKVEEPKAEEPKAEEPKAEEPKAEEPKVEEPKAEEPKAEEPKAEEPKAEEGARSADLEKEIRSKEIARQADIRSAVRAAKLDESFADKLVKEEVTIDQARALIIKELEVRTSTKTINQRIEVRDMEQKELRRAAAVRALLHRFNPSKYQMQDGDREYRQGSILDLARHFLAQEGVRDAYTMSRAELAKRALHSSSDFPEVLANTANKSLRDAYMGAPNTYAPFVAQRNVSDFKEISSVQLGNGGKLEKVNEHGEYKRTTVEESAEKYKVEKFGLILGRTWELIVNDDMDAFTRIPASLGVRAREKENETFWGLIISNPAMADGDAFFHANHGNTGTGVIAVAGVGAGRAKMRVQKDLEGEIMSVTPRYLVVPAALETLAEQFTSSIQPQATADVNPFAGKLVPVVEPRLDANSAIKWYLGADKAQLAAAEMALLDGAGPEMFVREGFEIDGMELKLRYVFGMKLIDYRAMYSSTGA